jgi:hypothetical protein
MSSSKVMGLLENIGGYEHIREQMLKHRVSLLPQYMPSFLEFELLGEDAFNSYGYSCIASLKHDSGKVFEFMWDMPCIFSHIAEGIKTFSPEHVLDITEYDVPKKYTLTHMLCLIIEVSSSFRQFSQHYRYDNTTRICNNKKCCNPYHRSLPRAQNVKTIFFNRLWMHTVSFETEIKLISAQKLNVAIFGKDVQACKSLLGEKVRLVPSRVFIGRVDHKDLSGEDLAVVEDGDPSSALHELRNRIYVDGNARKAKCAIVKDWVLEVECVLGDGSPFTWVKLSVVIENKSYPGYVDISKTIEASGGNLHILKLCLAARIAAT